MRNSIVSNLAEGGHDKARDRGSWRRQYRPAARRMCKHIAADRPAGQQRLSQPFADGAGALRAIGV
jgi:hypothetical protein